jgi:hypothetical protein
LTALPLGDPANLANRKRLEKVDAIDGGKAERFQLQGGERIARPVAHYPIGGALPSSVELDPGPDACTATNVAMQIQRHLIPVQQVDVQGEGGGLGNDTQPGKAFAALDHRRQPKEIGKLTGISMIAPAQPEHQQPFAHRPIGIGGLRLDTCADDITHQAVDRCRDPRVVARIPSRTSRRRGRACQDRRVQPIDRPRPLPTPTNTRSVKAAHAGAGE